MKTRYLALLLWIAFGLAFKATPVHADDGRAYRLGRFHAAFLGVLQSGGACSTGVAAFTPELRISTIYAFAAEVGVAPLYAADHSRFLMTEYQGGFAWEFHPNMFAKGMVGKQNWTQSHGGSHMVYSLLFEFKTSRSFFDRTVFGYSYHAWEVFKSHEIRLGLGFGS